MNMASTGGSIRLRQRCLFLGKKTHIASIAAAAAGDATFMSALSRGGNHQNF
jgi:hypothetical protein